MARPGLCVSDYMTADPLTLSPEDNLMQALEVMRLRKIRRLPVTIGETLVGIVTEGDLKRAEPSMLSQTEDDFNRVMEETPVSRIMIRDPMTVAPDTPLLDAASTLHENKYGAMPVVKDARLVGILTVGDLVHALVDLLQGETAGGGPA